MESLWVHPHIHYLTADDSSQDKMEGAAASRLEAQTHKKHYATRLAEVKAKVDDAEASVKVAEEEFEVGPDPFCDSVSCVFLI